MLCSADAAGPSWVECRMILVQRTSLGSPALPAAERTGLAVAAAISHCSLRAPISKKHDLCEALASSNRSQLCRLQHLFLRLAQKCSQKMLELVVVCTCCMLCECRMLSIQLQQSCLW